MLFEFFILWSIASSSFTLFAITWKKEYENFLDGIPSLVLLSATVADMVDQDTNSFLIFKFQFHQIRVLQSSGLSIRVAAGGALPSCRCHARNIIP